MAMAYYISGHGFGHAARQGAVIQHLADIPVYVRSNAPHKFFDYAHVVHHHQQAYDVGMVQSDALTMDVDATFAHYADLIQRAEDIIAQEVAFIRQHDIRLIVSDMPPIAFDIAQAAGVAGVAMTHFTWDWVYDYYVDGDANRQRIVDHIRQSYAKATIAYQMPFAHAFDMFPMVEPLPLVVNAISKTRDDICREMAIPPENRIGLISMGGLGWSQGDITALRQLTGWTFLVMPGIYEQVRDWPQCRLVPTGYRNYHNLIAAADVVVGKAGGSTVTECIAHRTPMIYMLRANWRENSLLDAALRQYANSIYVPEDDFNAGRWADHLETIVTRPYTWPPIATNGAQVAADKLRLWLNRA